MFNFRNVNDAFTYFVRQVQEGDQLEFEDTNSRNGKVRKYREPILVGYRNPLQRVLFNRARDANPFFHLYESLWMLAGRNDVAPLKTYNSTIGQFSDDGKTLNGAYGYRWRGAECWNPDVNYPDRTDVDQLDILVAHLRADPTSRRAVLQMWNVEDDLLKIGQQCDRCGGTGSVRVVYPHTPSPQSYETATPEKCGDCGGMGKVSSKDVCCNLSVMFSIRRVCTTLPDYHDKSGGTYESFLDMTVTNRSNDIIWGMLGANYVHFSFLLEYMAARLGVSVGRYYHFTNNAHVYVEREDWKPDSFLGEEKRVSHPNYDLNKLPPGFVPLVRHPDEFERELPQFVEMFSQPVTPQECPPGQWGEPFLEEVATPMLLAYHEYKANRYLSARGQLLKIKPADWGIASSNWLHKRAKRKGGTL